MTDLTRTITEALGCEAMCSCGCAEPLEDAKRSARLNPGWLNEYQAEAGVSGECRVHGGEWPCPEATRIAAALAPLIEARVREARADECERLADDIQKNWSGPDDPWRTNAEAIVSHIRDWVEEVRHG